MAHDTRINWYGFLLNDYRDFEGVYALYDNKGNLLYIGETTDLRNRMINHLISSVFKDMIHRVLFYETDLLNRKHIEFIMIDICQPIFNKQNQDVFMRERKHELVRDMTLPEYDCSCRACKPWLEEHVLKREKELQVTRRSDEWYRRKREKRFLEKRQLNMDNLLK